MSSGVVYAEQGQGGSPEDLMVGKREDIARNTQQDGIQPACANGVAATAAICLVALKPQQQLPQQQRTQQPAEYATNLRWLPGS